MTRVFRSADGSTAFAMAGRDACFEATLARLYLGCADRPVVLERLHWGKRSAACARLAARHGLAIQPISARTMSGERALVVPRYVSLRIDLPDGLDAHLAGLCTSARNDLRLLRAGGYDFDTAHAPEDLQTFHDDFYLPSIRGRFQAEAVIADRAELAAHYALPGAELLRIRRGGVHVSSALAIDTGETYRLLRFGWLRGDPEVRRRGALAAIYAFALRRTTALGRPTIILGATLPVIEDGVMACKTKWGGRLDVAGSTHGDWLWHIDPAHPDLRRFLQSHTLIARGHGNRLVAYGAKPPPADRAHASLVASLSAWYRLRDTPDGAAGTQNIEVPAGLRAWFAEESLPLTADPQRVASDHHACLTF